MQFKHYETTAWLTLANLLTGSRILLTPFVMHALWHGYMARAVFLFALASLTDLFDGFAARSCGAQSTLGRLLDPLADKCLLVGTSIAAFWCIPVEIRHILLPTWLVILIVVREIGMLVGAWLIWRHAPQFVLAPHLLGKLATLGLCLLLGIALSAGALGWQIDQHGLWIFSYSVAVLLVAASAVYAWWVMLYLCGYRKSGKNNPKSNF